MMPLTNSKQEVFLCVDFKVFANHWVAKKMKMIGYQQNKSMERFYTLQNYFQVFLKD